MRDIKFRIWDGLYKKMYHQTEDYYFHSKRHSLEFRIAFSRFCHFYSGELVDDSPCRRLSEGDKAVG